MASFIEWIKNWNDFQKKTVLYIFILFVFFLLVAIVATMRSTKKKESWPPTVGNCPDYWIDISENGSKCVNTKYLGTCVSPKIVNPNDSLKENIEDIFDEAQKMDFTVSPFVGSNGMCNKKQWADRCGLAWNGITFGYGDTSPCQ